jgi:membrane dipeptidase
MNRLGMIVDGAHAAVTTLQAIVATSRSPIIVSHTGPAATRTSSRHLDDASMKLVAAKGGVIGIWPYEPRGRAALHQMILEIDYVRRLVGIDHVGVGTDMDGMSIYTAMPTYKEFAPLPAALLAYGFSESDTRKVLGGNLMRVFDESTAAR